jgi:hypothetical protein
MMHEAKTAIAILEKRDGGRVGKTLITRSDDSYNVPDAARR